MLAPTGLGGMLPCRCFVCPPFSFVPSLLCPLLPLPALLGCGTVSPFVTLFLAPGGVTFAYLHLLRSLFCLVYTEYL